MLKIVHLCFTGPVTDGLSYQDNLLPKHQVILGYTVTFITSEWIWGNDGQYSWCEKTNYYNEDGVYIIRLPFSKKTGINSKFKRFSNIYEKIEDENPDILFIHGCQFLDIKQVINYIKDYPKVKVYVDNHADYNNSATNWFSKNILHKIIWKHCAQAILPYTEKYFAVAHECRIFLKELYTIPDKKIELFPLGGIVFSEKVRVEKRLRKRKELKIDDNEILLVHSGKMDQFKRTKDILDAFIEVKNEKLKFIIIGTFSEDVKENTKKLINNDKRIQYLGWKNSEELMEYLCASDLYVQPGGQSATMQNAACCGSALALYPHKSHKYLMKDTVFYIETVDDMKCLFEKISENRKMLEEKKMESFALAKEILDYSKLAKRVV